jgi:beta-glucosidase/6-phospho-beta-glucosidase/beta-galactosidase
MRFLSGFESTHIFGTGKDVLELTGHTENVDQDLRLARKTGMEQLRYSVPWHKVERIPGTYDWAWMDEAMLHMRALGIDPILDPLHHTSFPQWLEGGFANANFASLYLRFVTEIAERYPWARHYTVINEPFVTTWFCGHEGTWYPYYRGPENFVPMLMNVIEAIVSVTNMLIEKIPGVQFVHVDAAERHREHDEISRGHAEMQNKLRFIVPDLVLGHVDENHALYEYLTKNGARKSDLLRFRENPGRIDILGLDYYAHCELEWCQEGRVLPNRGPEGLVPTALEYAERYRLPIMLSETNIRGFVSDRISWLKFMVEQCEEIERKIAPMGLPFEGFCWYPFIDSTDWCSLVKEAKGCIDPQGIIWLDDKFRRHTSELSDIYQALAKGQITSTEIPAYHFQPPVDEELRNFLPMMSHWNWQDPLANEARKTVINLPTKIKSRRSKSERVSAFV